MKAAQGPVCFTAGATKRPTQIAEQISVTVSCAVATMPRLDVPRSLRRPRLASTHCAAHFWVDEELSQVVHTIEGKRRASVQFGIAETICKPANQVHIGREAHHVGHSHQEPVNEDIRLQVAPRFGGVFAACRESLRSIHCVSRTDGKRLLAREKHVFCTFRALDGNLQFLLHMLLCVHEAIRHLFGPKAPPHQQATRRIQLGSDACTMQV
mmetsp:Transcript_41725/g.110423  ORF Transcript_41725/g.110423 Transcript_41725/m.110423 type:complete len:211 (+) Transcript_41725:227-859(+)